MKLLMQVCGALIITVALTPFAHAQGEGKREVLRAADGQPIHITYYPFRESKDSGAMTALTAPVVILLHGEKSNRLAWDKNSAAPGQDPFPILLQKRGYVVISVDLRKHGDSITMGSPAEADVNALDYQAMVIGDLPAVKEFLYQENQAKRLNMTKLGIVAVDVSAPVAAAFAEFDWTRPPFDDAPIPANRTPRGQDVKALVLISPSNGAGRLKTNGSLKLLRAINPGIALQVIVGGQDAVAKKQAQTLFESYAPPRSSRDNTRVEFLTPDTKESGMALFRQTTVYAFVFKFLETNLKPLDFQWQDRRSRLE